MRVIAITLAALSGQAFGFAPYPKSCPSHAADPPVPGVLQGVGQEARVVLGVMPNYPPYAMWTETNPKDLGGYVVELGALFEPTCGIAVEFTLVPWSGCWGDKPDSLASLDIDEYVGPDIWDGRVHGCSSYTHTRGERELSLEFTDSILGKLKTAGILTRLEEGKPIISPSQVDYTGIKLGDVTGWAPTSDTFDLTTNHCVEGAPQFVKSDPIISDLPEGNEAAINALRNGTIDALYIYADQLYNFIVANDPLAEGFGTEFAYIHTGLDGWANNGTTFAISKRGSGLKQVLDPCIAKVVQTPEYTEICEKYFESTNCIGGEGPTLWYDVPMDERTDSYTCADGYCTCSE